MPQFGQPTGYAQITVGGTAILLSASVPRTDGPGGTGDIKANYAILRVSGNHIRIRQDGTAPTASVGFPLLTTDTESFVLLGIGALKATQMIAETGSATVDVLFFSGGNIN